MLPTKSHRLTSFPHPAIELPPAVIETARAGQEPCPLVGVPDMKIWPVTVRSNADSLDCIGWDPYSRFPHEVGVPLSKPQRGVDLLRYPGSKCRLPRRRGEPSRAYRLVLSLERPPTDLLAAAAMPITELFIAYRNAKHAEDPPCRGIHFSDYTPDDAVFALRALRRAGVCEARAEAVKEYMRGFGPGSPRSRIERATRAVLESARQ